MNLNAKLVLTAAALGWLAGGVVQQAHAALPTDACSLLTEAQVSAALGISASPGHSVPSDSTVCDWPLTDLAKALAKGTREVEVKILDSDTWDLITPAANGSPQVEGVGDYAVYLGPDDSVTLYVKKGNTKISVNVHGFTVDQVKAKEKTLAQDVMAKL
jgi:hypothetical protein